MNAPCCLAVDRRDNVFVADWNNNRVLILNRTMSHIGDVTLGKEGVSSPWRVWVDEVSGRLFIGEGFSSGRLLVVEAK